MKILYHHRIRSKDGQFVHVEELTRALSTAGHELIFVGPRVIETGEFGADGGFAARLKRLLPGWLYELLELGYSLFDFLHLARVMRSQRPDCIYERYNLFLPSGVWASRVFRVPLLLEVNAPLFSERSRYGGLSLKRVAASIERYTWRGADVVLPVTEVLAGIVAEAGVPRDRITVIPNGIDPARFASIPERAAAKSGLGLGNAFVLGFAGFVRDWHRLDRVLEYLARSGNGSQHLLLVGDGPAIKQLRSTAERLGVADRFSVTGIVERDDIVDYLAAFDVALQPSVVEYASPLKLFEYLAMAHAIVAPRTDNLREVLRDGENALLFDPDSDDELYACIDRVIGDDDLRRTLRRNAQRTIISRGLTWSDNASRVVRICERLGVSRDAPAGRPSGAK